MNVYFEQSWNKFEEDGALNLKDGNKFLKHLMTNKSSGSESDLSKSEMIRSQLVSSDDQVVNKSQVNKKIQPKFKRHI